MFVPIARGTTSGRRCPRPGQNWISPALVCVGDLAAGGASLAQAAELRRGLGDARGAKYSARNAAMATRPRGLWTWIAGHSVLLGIALALIVAGAVAAATVPSSQPTQSPP